MFLCLISIVNSQTAPTHLKYFGFALIDCLYDDPSDTATTTNYITEVDSFSNIAHMCVYNHTDDIINRVNLMNSHCVLPIVHIQNIFYEAVDTLAPSGENFDLISNFTNRWNTFKTTNISILDSTKIGAFYIADEPFWNGLTFLDLDTVCSIVKADFPNIPIMLIEAYPLLSSLQVPTTVDWLGFDEYGIFNPGTDPTFLADLALLKSKRSNPNQEIFLTIDDQWLPFYGAAGFTPDTIRFMVQNYYDLAASDPEIIGLLGYLWPGGLDHPGQLGVRNMPQSVIDKNIEIGQMIKANFSPCTTTSIESLDANYNDIFIYPNPSSSVVSIQSNYQINKVLVYNNFGQQVLILQNNSKYLQIDIANIPNGIYFLKIHSNKRIVTRKIIKNN